MNRYLLQYNISSSHHEDDDNPAYPKKKLLTFVKADNEEHAEEKLKAHIKGIDIKLTAYKIKVIPTIE